MDTPVPTPLAPAPKPEAEAIPAPAPVVEAPKPPVEAPKKSVGGSPFKGRSPCDWHILAGEEDGMIVASNSNTGESFEGSIVDFNARLNG